MAKTKIGLEENVAGLLCYVFGFFSGIIMFAIERDNKFVKFHALQSLVVFLGLWIISIFIGLVPIIGGLIALLIMFLSLFLWIFLMIKAFKGEKYMVPVAGDFVEGTLMSKADEIASQASEPQKPSAEETPATPAVEPAAEQSGEEKKEEDTSSPQI